MGLFFDISSVKNGNLFLLVLGSLLMHLEMDKVAAMESRINFKLDDSRRAEEGSGLKSADLPQTSLPDGQITAMHRCQEMTEDRSAFKYKRYSGALTPPSSPLSGVKVGYKRQVLQDMARPLKHWLYKHRDHPYPTKTEQVLLALGSQMTLVQVSNWFANIRRRLKNTVRHPVLSWALRIKLYNKYIQGNAERLSVCSDDTDSDDEERTQQALLSLSNLVRSSSHRDNNTSPPSKYKSSSLNRYVNDTLRHVMWINGAASACNRSLSEAFSFNRCDQDVCPSKERPT